MNFKKTTKFKIVTLIVSFGFILFSLEIMLNIINWKKNFYEYGLDDNLNQKVKLYKKKTGLEFNTNTRYEEFVKSGKVHKVTIPPKTFINKNTEIFPLAGFSNVNTIFCNENGFMVKYKSDRYGFNNQDNIWDNKEFDYVLIGDSFIHGACVNREDNLASFIHKISGKKALNLGYSGNGPLINLATLREYVPNNVKNIVWFFYENDFGDYENEITNSLLNNYILLDDYSQNLKKKKNEISQILSKSHKSYFKFQKKKLQLTTRLKSIVKLYYLRNIYKKISYNNKKTEERLSYLEKKTNLINFISLIKKIAPKNSKIHIVYLPSYNEIKNKNYKKLKYIESTVRGMQIKFINFITFLENNSVNKKKIFPFELHGHYNKLGYELLSKAIISETN